MKNEHALAAAVLAAFLAGCGGGGTGDAGPGGTPAGPDTPRATGVLLQSPPLRAVSVSPATLKAMMENGPTRDKTLLKLAGDPICSVDVRYLQYTTVGGAGEATSASGALMVPGGTDARCTGARPIVLYGHATHPEKNFNLAALGDNTNPAYTESLTIAAIFAARGYIVVAPNYAGYDSSTLGYHPFLNGAQQSGEMQDALAAAKRALPTFTPTATPSTQLFLTGYSQGGYAALATQRALEQAGVTVTASAPMSGPYALARELDANFTGQVHVASTLFATLLATSYQRSYKNVYNAPTDLFESAYAPGIETLLPGPDTTTLAKTGKLPDAALFSQFAPQAPAGSTLQPAFNAMTPATGTQMDKIFAFGFGPNNLFTNSFRAAYLTDYLLFPNDPKFGLRIDAKANDLRGYLPKAPVFLCGGAHDATVSFDNNTLAMRDSWAGLPSGRVSVLDVDDTPNNTNDPYFDEKFNFALVVEATKVAARQGGVDPDLEVAKNYHAAVYPFCASAVGKFFSKF